MAEYSLVLAQYPHCRCHWELRFAHTTVKSAGKYWLGGLIYKASSSKVRYANFQSLYNVFIERRIMQKHATAQSLNIFEENYEGVSGLKRPLKRRSFLKLATVSVGLVASNPLLARIDTNKERVLNLYNPRLDGSFKSVYWTPNEGYIAEALEKISWVLRDHHNNQVKDFDPVLLDQMYLLRLKMDSQKNPLHVVSGYRSPNTNEMLRRKSKRVAKNSFHMHAKAVDIYMPNRSVSALHRAALSMKAGGVGYYPRSNFIHIDTGPVRTW
jgi:uncharacterized protein YcbK (DUF882 family)